jgi:bifunctional NMN adenylyltransferase/nudix hydrolase
LPAGPLPRVKGGDDAAKAQWVPIADIKSETCFEDHDEIIHNMLGY